MGLVTLGLLLVIGLIGTGCARTSRNVSSRTSLTEREANLEQIADDYAHDGDLSRARAALDELGLANPAQLLITMAEQDINEGRSRNKIAGLARLAEALGMHSPRLAAYLAPTVVPSPLPPSPTPVLPTLTSAPTATPPPATPVPTSVPPTETPSLTPQPPRVQADQVVNVRSGPGTNYPVVGQMQAEETRDIIGRNANGDWWRVVSDDQGQAWVAGKVVNVLGPIDAVAVAQDVPAPPPTFTSAPPPPPTEPPKPAVDYVVRSLRLRPVGQDAQRCTGGDHNIFVLVQDAAGNPLNGVRVREIFSGQVYVTGAQGKGAGRVEYDIYKGGGGQLEIVGDDDKRISEVTRGMSSDWPDFDLMRDAGYCQCKPHPDDASCEADLVHRTYLFAKDHYVYEVVFERTW